MSLKGMKYKFSSRFYREQTFVDKSKGLIPLDFELKLRYFSKH
jgi:hypothetical protein